MGETVKACLHEFRTEVMPLQIATVPEIFPTQISGSAGSLI